MCLLLTYLFHLHLVEVAAAVLEVAHAAVGVELVEQVEVDIGDENHLGVGGSLGAASVGGEGEVAGGEDSRLGILDVHVVHLGQVAHATGNDHEALVFDGPGLSADPYARVGILRVGEEGDEEYLHAFAGHDARQLGELDIVADEHAYLGAVGLEGADGFAAVQAPALHLVGGDVQFLVHLVGTVATAQVADVVEKSVLFDEGHAAGDDVDVVADGQVDEPLAYLVGVLGQTADGLRLALVVEAGHEGGVEVFGEEHEVALVAAHRVDEELDLFEEVVERLVAAHPPLHESHPHGRLGRDILFGRLLVVDVVPLEQAGEMFRLLVVGQVVAHHLAHVEVVGELEEQYRVEYLALAHLVDVLFGAHVVGILVVVGQPAAEHDGLEVEFFAQLLAVFIHTAGEPQAAVVGVHEYLDAVEDVTLAGVGVEGFVAGHLSIGVVVFHIVVVDDDREGASHDFAIDHGHDLPFGEDADEFVYLFGGPEHVAAVGIDPGERAGQLVVVFALQITNLDFIDLFGFHSFVICFAVQNYRFFAGIGCLWPYFLGL